jgi:mannosyltransferase
VTLQPITTVERTSRPRGIKTSPFSALARQRVVLLAITLGLVSAALCFAGSWIPSLWGDEVTSVVSAERSLPSLFRMLGNVDAVHGTYYLFLHFWIEVFGASPVSVRSPSAIAAGTTVAGVVFLASRLATFRTAVFAGLICMVLPRITYSGAEARSYAFTAALAVWLTVLLVHLLAGRRSRRWWMLYAVGVAASGYLFLFSLLILPAHATLVAFARTRGQGRAWLKSVAGGLVLAAPVIGFGFVERGQIAFLTDRTAATVKSITIGQWFGNATCATVCWALLVAAIVFAIVRARRPRVAIVRIRGLRESSLPLVAGVWLLFPPAALLLVNFVDPIYSSRYLTFATPGYALLVGYLLGRAKPRWLAILLAAVVASTAFSSYVAQRGPYAENGSDWAVDAAYIHAHAGSGDGILFDETINPSKRPRLALRAYPADFVGLDDLALRTGSWNTDTWYDSVYPLADVASRLQDVRTVWLIEYRAPGGTADTYDLATLASLGYTRVSRTPEHSSVILEFRHS